MNKLSKRYSAAIAGILILLYHCWIPLFAGGTTIGNIERFILTSSFWGVDIFFFISAYTLSARPVTDYPAFLFNRSVRLLPLFLIALLFKKFLWFIPAIMIMYVLFPPVYKACIKKPGVSFVLLIAVWAGITYLVLGVIKPSQDFGIFLFRIPCIILGAYAPAFEGKLTKKLKISAGIVLLILGTAALYEWGYLHRLNIPFRGTFYLVGIPSTIGIVLLVSVIADHFSSRVFEKLGEMTLELYFTQMVMGTFLINTFFGLFRSRIITNLTTVLIIAAVSLIIHEVYRLMLKS